MPATQGIPKRSKRLPAGPDAKLQQPDPTLLCCAFQRQRLYLFSQREPAESEDVAQVRGEGGREGCSS